MACRNSFTFTFVVVVLILVPSVLLNPGTFKDTFVKKCLAYKNEPKTCEKMWVTFQKAYVGKQSKEVLPANYETLLKDHPYTHPCDKTMLWSGVSREAGRDLVHEFTATKKIYLTLEDTWLGKTLDGLSWCGKKNSKETFTACEKEKPNPVFSFWVKASEKMAQYACGEVTVMLDGSRREQPLSDKSILVATEIPNLQTPKVTKLMVVLLVKKNENQCNKQTLKDLKKKLDEKKIAYSCKEVTETEFRNCINTKTLGPCW
ncbi:ADP-ribosyl cyclase/cyclic ADP-ribose hydrolase 1-like isoform X1 [Cheilinus undulatus]|uniref:ADP-ribosyl cyclase/cyclic ADP-ribose hydrolase 1-like isoform X1 n=1 Tax=Cheilinus undulatus TaxID=241271 RepID=UPI001BD6CEEC|nr:ADP-ribosyl cyclase/cyclic ADP-ribose hydrolase 1-like isoform X1 [Cheilinus undulatus]